MKSSKFDIFKLEFTPRIPEIERGLRDYFLKMHRIRKIKPESIKTKKSIISMMLSEVSSIESLWENIYSIEYI